MELVSKIDSLKEALESRDVATYKNIQLLRFIAAALVIVTHITLYYGDKILELGRDVFWHKGMMGVDIFFVISGFVMGVSGQKFITMEFEQRLMLQKEYLNKHEVMLFNSAI